MRWISRGGLPAASIGATAWGLCMACGLLAATGPADVRTTHVLSTSGDRFILDGKPFEMWGIRVASATKDTAVARHLIAQLDDYKAHGVSAVTVFYSGSSAGYWDPFTADGRQIDAGHRQRMDEIIRQCDQRGMVVIAGIFYQRVAYGLKDAQAVQNAVRSVARALKPSRNVIINIANEQNSGRYAKLGGSVDLRDPNTIGALCKVVHEEDPERLVGSGGYDHRANKIIGCLPDVNVLLFDTAGPNPDSGNLFDEFVAAGVKGKPIVNVETFGAWTIQQGKPGVFTNDLKKAYMHEVDVKLPRQGLSVFFHNNPWCQGPSTGNEIRYDLAGQGTADAPGIRWYFEYVRDKRRQADSAKTDR